MQNEVIIFYLQLRNENNLNRMKERLLYMKTEQDRDTMYSLQMQ